MIKKLLELVKPKRKVLIQTHNNPDPDTIAAAVGLKDILSRVLLKRVTIAYMGIIGREENKELVRSCKIELYHLDSLDISRYDYYIVVDTQPRAGNVYDIDGRLPDAVIDHHYKTIHKSNIPFEDIRTNYGSTSTIIAEYYRELNMIPDKNIATALYYGIKTDAFGTARANIQADINMISFVFPHISVSNLNKIENPELPKYYFANIHKAIERAMVIDKVIICDLNKVKNADLIAEMSDFLLRMKGIKSTFVLGRIGNTCHFSLRYKTKQESVGNIAVLIVKDIGYGGGHMKSAGGQVPLNSELNYEEAVELLTDRLLEILNVTSAEMKSLY